MERLLHLARGLPTMKVSEGEILFRQGDPALDFLVVLDGMVETTHELEPGLDVAIAVLGPGSVVGDVLQPFPPFHSVSAKVAKAGRIVRIGLKDFEERLLADGELFIELVSAAAEAVEAMVAQANRLKLQSTAKRLAGYFCGLAEAQGGDVVTLPFAKQDLARHLGMTPPSLSRSLRRLNEIGVTVSGRKVTIADRDRVRAFCEDY